MFKFFFNVFFVISGVIAWFWRVFIKFRWHGQKLTSEYNVKILKKIFSNFVAFSDYLIFSKQTSQIVNYNYWILLGHCSKVFLSFCQFLEHFFIPNLERYFIAKKVYSSFCSMFSFQFLALVIGLKLGDCFDYFRSYKQWNCRKR